MESTTAHVVFPGGEIPWAFEKVAGLFLFERILMGLKRAGVDQVCLCCDLPAQLEIGHHLNRRPGDPRWPRSLCFGERGEARSARGTRLVVDGRTLHHPELYRQALGSKSSIRYVTEQGEDAGLSIHREDRPIDPDDPPGLDEITVPKCLLVLRVDGADGIGRATQWVFRSLIKPTDGWFSVHLNRPLSLSISRALVHRDVHPNWITLIALAAGVLSGLFSALGTYAGFALGGLLYQAASVLDGVDGELSRAKFLESRTGQWLDTVCDDLTNALYLGGVTLGLMTAGEPGWLGRLGVAAVAMDVVTISIMYYLLVVRFKSGTLLGFEWDFMKAEKKTTVQGLVSRLEPLMKRDCYAFLFMALGLLNASWIAIPLSVTGISITFAVLIAQIIAHARGIEERPRSIGAASSEKRFA